MLIVEDMIVTGKTILKLKQELSKYDPKSVKVCTLLFKRVSTCNNFEPDYVGFSIPDRFVVGHAIDLNEHFRDLEHICVIKPSSLEKYSNIMK